MHLPSDWGNRRRIGRQRLRRWRRHRRRWRGWRWAIWHGYSPLTESFLLQRLAGKLINTNGSADEIPIFLIRKSTSAGGPGKLMRRFRMIGVVSMRPFKSAVRRDAPSVIDLNLIIVT